MNFDDILFTWTGWHMIVNLTTSKAAWSVMSSKFATLPPSRCVFCYFLVFDLRPLKVSWLTLVVSYLRFLTTMHNLLLNICHWKLFLCFLLLSGYSSIRLYVLFCLSNKKIIFLSNIVWKDDQFWKKWIPVDWPVAFANHLSRFLTFFPLIS